MRKIIEGTIFDRDGRAWHTELIAELDYVQGGQDPRDGKFEWIEQFIVSDVRYVRESEDGQELRLFSKNLADSPDIFLQKEINRLEAYAKAWTKEDETEERTEWDEDYDDPYAQIARENGRAAWNQ